MLKYEVPVVYEILMGMLPDGELSEPPYLLVKMICEKSEDVTFKKNKFFRYLEEYKQLGLYCKRAQHLTANRKIYYEDIRRKKMENYIMNNLDQIERMERIINEQDVTLLMNNG